MKNIILLLLFFLTTNIYAQETHVSEIYSPEYKKKLEKEKTAEVKKESPNKMVLRLGIGTFANYTYGHDNLQDKTFNMFNWMYSGMIGYRTGFNAKSYKFSSSGRDKNRAHVVGVFYEGGYLPGTSLENLGKDYQKVFTNQKDADVRFQELQFGFMWKEFIRISAGVGKTYCDEFIIERANGTLKTVIEKEELSYPLVTTGVNLRFGRLSPTLNYTIISSDGFDSLVSRWDVQLNVNFYFWKKILKKDKHKTEVKEPGVK